MSPPIDNSIPYLLDSKRNNYIPITNEKFTVGRSLSASFTIEDKVVSRIHFILEKNTDGWVLTDKSTNGTYVNNDLIIGSNIPIKNNDKIKIVQMKGKFQFIDNTFDVPAPHIFDKELCELMERYESETLNSKVVQKEKGDKKCSGSVAEQSTSRMVTRSNSVQASSSGENKVLSPITRSSQASSSEENKVLPPVTRSSQASGSREKKVLPSATKGSQASSSGVRSENKSEEPCTKKPKLQSKVEVKADEVKEVKVEPSSSSAVSETNKRNEIVENEFQCSICSEVFIKTVTINCSHSFCDYCLRQWMKVQKVCPICRTNITAVLPTRAVDNFITNFMESASEETKAHRQEMIKIREEEDKKETKQPNKSTGTNPGTSGTNPGTSGTSGSTTTTIFNFNDSSGTSSSTYEDEDSNGEDNYDYDEYGNYYWEEDDDVEEEDDEDEDDDDDYDDTEYNGVSGVYYGGYGRCYKCKQRGHWANGCPN